MWASLLDTTNSRHCWFTDSHGVLIWTPKIGWKRPLTITLQGTNISPQSGIFEDDFPNFPRWDMLIHWRVSLHGVWEHLWIDDQVPAQCSSPAVLEPSEMHLGPQVSLPMAGWNWVKALSVFVAAWTCHICFKVGFKHLAGLLISGVYYFWQKQNAYDIGVCLLDGSCSEKCFFFCSPGFKLVWSSPLPLGHWRYGPSIFWDV